MTFAKRLRSSAERIRDLAARQDSHALFLAEAKALDDLARELDIADQAAQDRELIELQADAVNRLDILKRLLAEEGVISSQKAAEPSGMNELELFSPDRTLKLAWGIDHWDDVDWGPISYVMLQFLEAKETIALEYKTKNKRWGTQFIQNNPHTPYTQLPDVTQLLETLTIGPTRKLVTMRKVRLVVHELCDCFKRSLEPSP